MPEDNVQIQQPSAIEEDQAQAFEFQQQLRAEREQERAAQKQLAVQAILEGSEDSTTLQPVANDVGLDDEQEADEGEEEDGAEEVGGEEESKRPAPLIPTYASFIFFAFLIDVVIDALGGFILLSPLSWALGFAFKVPGFFFLTRSGKKEKFFAKSAVMGICAVFGFLPGDNLASVLVSLFLDYKDKVLQGFKSLRK